MTDSRPPLPEPLARRTGRGTGAEWSGVKRFAAYIIELDWALYNWWEIERIRVFPPSSDEVWLQRDCSYEGMVSGSSNFFVMGEFREAGTAEQALKELAAGVALITKVMKNPGPAKGWTVQEDPAASVQSARAALAEKGVYEPTAEQIAGKMAISHRTYERYRAAGKVPRRDKGPS